MQYLLLIYANENAMLNAPKDVASQMLGAYRAYTEALTTAGALVRGAEGIGLADRLWAPDFRDRMLVIARPDGDAPAGSPSPLR